MSRAIQLTRIHALNWYGYRDSLPVKGNLVLAGVTGSGKSILMDLLMLVLVGPERARHHFNRSATGSRSDRTIKGYCLLDTKREENGQPQYFHQQGVTTYVAAEFTWPDQQRVETWGFRIEFRGTSEQDGSYLPFYCPASLERQDFLAISPEDGKSRPSSMAEFKSLIDRLGGRAFPSSREYLRDMSNPAHLNFNKDVLERLLPSAMSFTNLKSFDDFCRQFVLPSDSVPVDDVISSFRDFESYERELRELRGQLDRLTQIRSLSTTVRDADQDHQTATYLAAEASLEHAAAEVAACEQRLNALRLAFAEDQARLEQLETLLQENERQRGQLSALLHESPDGRLYQDLAARLRRIEDDLERLRDIGGKIDHSLGNRIRSARKWCHEVTKAPLSPLVDTSHLDEALRFLEAGSREESAASLSHLASAADHLCRQLRDRFKSDAEELRRLRAEKTELSSHADALRRGLPPVPQPLLHALCDLLPILPGQPRPQALRELCEVIDETWRPAAEAALTEKFAVLVCSEHYEQATEILLQLPHAEVHPATAATGPLRLIHRDKASAARPVRLRHSLAEIIQTDDPAARAYLDASLGDVIRVQHHDDLSRHESAVLPDGTMRRGAQILRPKPYDGMPFIGRNGLRRQLEIKLARIQEIDAVLRRLEPIEQEVDRLIAARNQEIPSHEDLVKQLVRVEELPAKQREHDALMKQLQSISTETLESLEADLEDLRSQAGLWDRERQAIYRKGAHKDIEQAEKSLTSRSDILHRAEDDFSRIRFRIDVSRYLSRYREWKQSMTESIPAADARAREFSRAADAARETSLRAAGDLRVAMLDFKKTYQPKFDEFPDDGADASHYESLLARIEDANIPDYERKAATERKRWEHLFRVNVLNRMQQAIHNVENIISLLNHQLKRPIGHDRYKIDRRPNPDFRVFRELIDLNATHIDDGLFFASIQGELRDALETFLTTLVRHANSPEAARLLDYRQYFDYDLLVTDIRDPDSKPVSVDKQSGKMSGGENQSPYFVAILASYLHAYNRHETRRKSPSLALVPIDEAFSKLSGERIQNCLQAMAELDLQGVFSMSSGNIPYAFSQCDELIVISRREDRRGNRVGIRNVPVILYRDSPEAARWLQEAAGEEKTIDPESPLT